ncbi:hypothetical protein Ciccas_011465, partial [Cichlidogyrus casuarinus]
MIVTEQMSTHRNPFSHLLDQKNRNIKTIYQNSRSRSLSNTNPQIGSAFRSRGGSMVYSSTPLNNAYYSDANCVLRTSFDPTLQAEINNGHSLAAMYDGSEFATFGTRTCIRGEQVIPRPTHPHVSLKIKNEISFFKQLDIGGPPQQFIIEDKRNFAFDELYRKISALETQNSRVQQCVEDLAEENYRLKTRASSVQQQQQLQQQQQIRTCNREAEEELIEEIVEEEEILRQKPRAKLTQSSVHIQ